MLESRQVFIYESNIYKTGKLTPLYTLFDMTPFCYASSTTIIETKSL